MRKRTKTRVFEIYDSEESLVDILECNLVEIGRFKKANPDLVIVEIEGDENLEFVEYDEYD